MSKRPWQRSKLEIEVIDVYASEIIGEDENQYFIEFYDSEMEAVEGRLPKSEFEGWPETVSTGTSFGIVLYKDNNIPKINAWPPERYWNPELI